MSARPLLTHEEPTGLELGGRGPLYVRRERLSSSPRVRLLYASDLHLTERAEHLPPQLMAAARATVPDAILLGGDLVDSARGHLALHACVRELARVAPVLAVPGNHDVAWGVALVARAVRAAGGVWLPDGGVALTAGDAIVRVDAAPTVDASGDVRVLCAHDPSVFPAAKDAGYALVMAGHLHGGQCVLARRGHLLYPARWIYRWNGLRFDDGPATMLVSRGASDTLPVRWNCPREVIACEL